MKRGRKRLIPKINTVIYYALLCDIKSKGHYKEGSTLTNKKMMGCALTSLCNLEEFKLLAKLASPEDFNEASLQDNFSFFY